MDIAALEKSPNADSLVKTIMEHDLARHIVELDAYGFTVIPPEKLGTSPGFAERLRDAILNTYQRRPRRRDRRLAHRRSARAQ